MIARALKPQTFTITMESTITAAAEAAVIVARAENIILSLYPKGFCIFVLGSHPKAPNSFRIFGYERFSYLSDPKGFCII